jgi:hypothetical protein
VATIPVPVLGVMVLLVARSRLSYEYDTVFPSASVVEESLPRAS